MEGKLICGHCKGIIENPSLPCQNCGARISCAVCLNETVEVIIYQHELLSCALIIPVCRTCTERLDEHFILYCLSCGVLIFGKWDDLAKKDVKTYLELEERKSKRKGALTFFTFYGCPLCAESECLEPKKTNVPAKTERFPTTPETIELLKRKN